MADTVGVGQETEKCDDPENRPEKYAFMKLWEPQLHLNMAFVEPGMDTGVLVGTAADNFSLCITAEIAVCENFSRKWHSQRQSSEPADQWRQKDRNKYGRIPESAHTDEKFSIPGTRSGFFKINLGGITFQIQSEIAEQTAAKTAVEVMLEHVMQHVKHIFRWRQYRIGLTVEFHERWFQMTGGKISSTSSLAREN